tara:strand:- start:106 stop:2835 length:2730 start_codon:yes stop_codon:yes gene_type:complete
MNKAPNNLGAFFIFNKMKLFFESIADEVCHKIDLEKTFFIIPNQRAKTFLKKEILKKITTPSISPHILSIDAFIQKIADVKETTRTNQLFYLYESYIKISDKKDFESYNLFRNWANTLLDDINDIDMGMADDTQVLKDLYEIHKLETLSIEDSEKSLAFWSLIPRIITDFKSKLIKNNLYSKGMCQIRAKENIEIFSDVNKDFSFMFLGLNSLSNTEQYIINFLLENNKTQVFWDCDDSFLENPEHEAGYFFRKYLNEWEYYKTNKFKISQKLLSNPKSIFIYETAKQIAQIETAVNILEKNHKDYKLQKTAIILPNQELLIPLVSSMPKSIKKLNLSISSPLVNMQLSKFAINFFEMYSRQKNKSFYHKDILNLLSSNFLYKSDKNHFEAFQDINSAVIKKNMVYVSASFISGVIKDKKIKKIFNCSESNILDVFVELIDLFETKIQDDTFLEQSSKIKSIIQTIKNFNSSHNYKITYDFLKNFFMDIIKSQYINFSGDPSNSLHVTGLLESRGLDFDNVIVCSANEGVLPSNNFHSSLMPFDLRKKYNLPTVIDEDAKTSYDFYHLLFRAKNIHLIYNSVSEGLNSGEKSRFIHQLELLKSEKHDIKQIISQYPFNTNEKLPIEFEKTTKLLSRLKEMAKSGFSPSSLNRYIDNPINFFDEYVLNVRSSDTVNELPEARGIGIIFHNTMESIYKPFTGKKVDIKKLKINLKTIDDLLDKEFSEEYGKNYDRGKNMVIYNVLKSTIKKLIQSDINKIKKGIELKIIDIEAKLEMDLITEKSNIKYKLKGTVDRIQSENGNVKIIDYKTGSFETYKLSFSDYQNIIDKKKKEAFQLLCYCLMYSNTNKKLKNLNAGIISFKNLSSGLINLKKPNTENYNSDELKNFKKILDNVVEEIFDPAISFSENEA